MLLASLATLCCLGCGGEEGPGVPPVAVLNVATETDVGGSLRLDATQSFDDDGDIQHYRFIVADGSPAFTTVEPSARHTFSVSGLIGVRLIIRDAKGNRGEDSAVVSVREP